MPDYMGPIQECIQDQLFQRTGSWEDLVVGTQKERTWWNLSHVAVSRPLVLPAPSVTIIVDAFHWYGGVWAHMGNLNIGM